MAISLVTDCESIHKMANDLAAQGRQVRIMEICGTHTMSIARSGLRSILPPSLKLVSGPGCPVCVTDQSYMDQAVYLARGGAIDPDGKDAPQKFDPPIIATYGDMVRVPGRAGSLVDARAMGARIEIVYSAEQAVDLAIRTPDKQVVFLGVGFETTAPATALSILRAEAEGVRNYQVLAAHKLVLPVMHALLAAGDVRVDGFLCPGHVSVILGYKAYDEISRKYGRPCVVAGFDPRQVVLGIVEILNQIRDGRSESCTVYPTVSAGGNPTAMQVLERVFEVGDAAWRAVGTVPASGLLLRERFAQFDAAKRFALPDMPSYELPGCRCGDVICGRCSPFDCKLFARRCTPRDPVGPCMVSSEGACAAAYKYERHGLTVVS